MRRFVWMVLLLGLSVVGCMHRRSDASRPGASATSSSKASGGVQQNYALATGVRSGNSATSALLAEGGVARMAVVVSTKAALDTRRAAEELAGFLGQATGAHFDVTTGDGSRGVVVGTAREFDVGVDAPSLAIKGDFDGREAFVVRSEQNRVLLVGGTELGVPHAVYSFLEAMGFRWFFPAKEWQETPSLSTLRVDLHLTDRPRLLSRQMSPGFGFFDPEAKSDWESWSRRNRVGGSLVVRINHVWDAIIANNKKEFDAHPEYYALSGGKRLTNKLCVTNPGVQKLAVAHAMKILQDPGVDMVSLEPSDGLGHCECDRCKAIGPPSAQPYFLANVVARELEKRHPHKLVGLLAYAEHAEPPPFPVEPNIFIEIANGYVYGKYSAGDLIELWPKAAHYLGHYEYFSVYQGDSDMLPGMRAADPTYLADQIRYYAAHSGVALTAETGNNWGPYGRAYYVTSRLMWNPDVDVPGLLHDFYAGAFHAAAPAMQRFYERFDPEKNPLMCGSLLRSGYGDVAEASRLVDGDARVEARLDQIKEYLHYVFSQFAIGEAQDPKARRALALDILTEGYRTRRSYMNHWRALAVSFSTHASKDYNEPSWYFARPGPHPWEVERPPSHSDVEQRFQREMAALPERAPVEEPAFSKHPVRVRQNFEAKRPVERTSFDLFTAQRFALSSDAGEPVEFTVKTALIAAYKNKPAARFTIRDGGDHVIAEGRVALDYGFHTITQAVPGAGIYYLDFNDSGAGFHLTVPDGHGVTLMLPDSGRAPSIGTVERFYFYVPKHTATVDYFWASGFPHAVHGSNGTLVQSVGPRKDWVSVPVPPGMDGKIWYLRSARVGMLKFATVPNQVSTASDALLVPEDVARADGLEIVRAPGVPATTASPTSSPRP